MAAKPGEHKTAQARILAYAQDRLDVLVARRGPRLCDGGCLKRGLQEK